jgi:plastocyanin
MRLARAGAGAARTAAVAVLLAGTACQSESAINREPHPGTGTASTTAGIQQITITTGHDYRFHPSTIIVHPGRVRVILVNEGHAASGAPHDWSLLGFPAAFVPLTDAGSRAAATFTAPAPGKYEFVCTIHQRQGQTGTLVVKAG